MVSKSELVRQMSFRELLDHYVEETVLDAGSVEQYEAVATLVERWHRSYAIGDLFIKSKVMAFRDWLGNEGRSPHTIRNKLRVYRMLWAYAIDEWDYDVPVPNFRRITPPIPRKLPEAWTPQEFALIRSKVDAAPEHKKWRHDDWRNLLDTLWYTGARIDALLGLQVKHLDGNVLTLPAELAKTLVEQRIELPADLAERIRTAPRIGLRLFPWPLTIDTMRVHYKMILKSAGLPSGRRDLLHKIRRTTATQVAKEHGLEAAARLLGHSSTRMTQDCYVDPTLLGDQKTPSAPPAVISAEKMMQRHDTV